MLANYFSFISPGNPSEVGVSCVIYYLTLGLAVAAGFKSPQVILPSK